MLQRFTSKVQIRSSDALLGEYFGIGNVLGRRIVEVWSYSRYVGGDIDVYLAASCA